MAFTDPSTEIIPFKALSLEGVRGVLIDLDGTLFDYEAAHAIAIRAVHATCADIFPVFETFNQDYRAARQRVVERLAPQGACRSRLFAFQDLFEEKGAKAPYAEALRCENLYWQSLIDAIRPDPEAMAFLARMKALGLPVCAVTDMQASVQIRKIQKLGLESSIAFMVSSEEVGAEKPDPRMFETALRKMKLRADEVVMLGDAMRQDIDGARRLGIKAMRVQARSLR